MKSLVYILSLVAFSSVNPEEVKKDLREINAHYASTESLTMQITYNYYTSYESTTPYEIKKGVTIKHGANKQYNKLEEIETIQNGDKLLQIDHESGNIVLRKRVKQENAMDKLMDMMSDVVEDCKTLNMLTSTASLKELEMSHPTSQYKKVVLGYHPQKYALSKMVLFLNQKDKPNNGGRLEIIMEENTKSTSGSDVFSLEKYITKTDDGYALKASYEKQYSLINLYRN